MINNHKPPCNVEYVNEFPFETTSVTTSGKNPPMTATFTVYAKTCAVLKSNGRTTFGRIRLSRSVAACTGREKRFPDS